MEAKLSTVNDEMPITDQAVSGKDAEPDAGARYFIRLNRNERNQHLIFAACFFILAITGFMIKLPESFVSRLGAYRETIFFIRSVIHRLAGCTMILVCLYHAYYLVFKPAGRRWLFDMLPRPKDVKDTIFNILYFLGFKKEPPEFDRFSYKHKLEYGALIAGSTLMSVSGLLLWTESMWSKFILDIAAVVHGMEAILACLAIMVWHIYEVQLKPDRSPVNNTWRTGLISEAEMKHEYAAHYKKILSDPKLQEIYIKKCPKKSFI